MQPDYEISRILKSIKLSVSRRAIGFLKTHSPVWLDRLKVTWPNGRTEYRFWQQGGGYDRGIYEDRVVLASIEYFHMNPVAAGLVEAPTDWRWSSARWYAGMDGVLLEMDPLPLLPV
jgi:putative transposase